MGRSKESPLDAKEVTGQGPKLRHKNRSLVTDDGVREAVMSNYYVNKYFHQFWSINGDFDWFVINHFGQAVDNDQNRVITLAFLINRQWKTGHKFY